MLAKEMTICKLAYIQILEVARPASEADKKSLPSLIFLSFGIFLLHSVNEVIRDRKRRINVRRNRKQYRRNGRSYSENALDSLLYENGEFMESMSSLFSNTEGFVSLKRYFTSQT